MSSTKNLFLFLTLVIFVCSSVFTQAQFKKGNWLVEGSVGSIGISNSNNEYEQDTTISKYESSNFSFGINPRAGYFVSDDFVIGLSLGLNYSSSENDGFYSNSDIKRYNSQYSSFSLSAAPFLRYYLPANASSHLRIYGQIEGGFTTYLSYNSETEYYEMTGVVDYKYKYDYPSKYFSYYVTPMIGLNYFLAQNVAFNGALGYRYSGSSETSNSTYTPNGGTPTKYPDSKYTYTSNSFTWSMGFTMIIP